MVSGQEDCHFGETMTFTDVRQRVSELKSRLFLRQHETDLVWLLGIVDRAVEEARKNVGCVNVNIDEMFCRIFQVEK